MKELSTLNSYTNITLLNLVLGWVFYAIYKERSLKIDRKVISIAAFYWVLLVDNWFTHFMPMGDLWYYVATATVFIPFSIFPSAKVLSQIAFLISLGTLLYFLNSEILIQFAYLSSIILILINAKTHLLSSGKSQHLGIILIIISIYLFLKAQQFTLMKMSGNWSQSKYLIYFAISDYIVFTTMLIVIHANFRRLFFN
jgi:hypothetical protein